MVAGGPNQDGRASQGEWNWVRLGSISDASLSLGRGLSFGLFANADQSIGVSRITSSVLTPHLLIHRIQNKKWKKDHVVDALTDPQVWAFVLIQFANTIPTGGLGAYSNIIISQNLGFSVLQAYLLSIAQGTWQILVLLSAAWLATKTKQTLLIMIVSLVFVYLLRERR